MEDRTTNASLEDTESAERSATHPVVEGSPALSIRDARKRFGSTLALDGVDLTVAPGEVHALLGENGAGKSTLMKILCGAVSPDAGAIELEGRAFRPRGPAHALRSGLAMIHQELTLAPHLSVEANVVLGLERTRLGFLRPRENRRIAREALARLGRADLDPRRPVHELGAGERQLVEIARALAGRARILVMDEPTSSLAGDDRERLFATIRDLRARGMSVIYVSHFLEEVRAICDRFTVLRDGRTVGTGEVPTTRESDWIAMMVGRRIEEMFPRGLREPGAPVLAVRALAGRRLPRRADFELRRGEILGVAGLVGAGRTESLRAIFGLDPIARGEVRIVEFDGREAAPGRGPSGRVRRGVGMVSEDRKGEGLALGLSVAENLAMSSPGTVSRWGIVSPGRLRRAATERAEEFSIRAAGPHAPVGGLSGGNQQKVAIARLVQQRADVLLLDEPTRGIDVGSKADVYRTMDRLAREGRAILFVSSYLPELLGVCDRVAVMSRGEVVAVRPAADWTEHEAMAAMTGVARG